jgi:hypothetical protein
VKDGTILHIDPPDGWLDGDTGKLYILANYNPNNYLTPLSDGTACVWSNSTIDAVEAGVLGECGTFAVTDGKIVTPPIPFLGWIGLKNSSL